MIDHHKPIFEFTQQYSLVNQGVWGQITSFTRKWHNLRVDRNSIGLHVPLPIQTPEANDYPMVGDYSDNQLVSTNPSQGWLRYHGPWTAMVALQKGYRPMGSSNPWGPKLPAMAGRISNAEHSFLLLIRVIVVCLLLLNMSCLSALNKIKHPRARFLAATGSNAESGGHTDHKNSVWYCSNNRLMI